MHLVRASELEDAVQNMFDGEFVVSHSFKLYPVGEHLTPGLWGILSDTTLTNPWLVRIFAVYANRGKKLLIENYPNG